MARTKQTPRRPTGRKPGEPAASRQSKKGFWGTAGRMVQRPIPSLPPHPQRRGFFYGGMYITVLYMCVHSTVYNVDTVEASKFIYLLQDLLHLTKHPGPIGSQHRPKGEEEFIGGRAHKP